MKNNKKVLITCTEEKHSLIFNSFLRFIHSFCFHMQTPGTFDQCGALGSWIIITSASNQSRCENHDDGVTSRKTVTAADLFARVSASEMTNVRQIPPVLILLPVAILKHVVTRRFWLANRDNEGSSCSSYSVHTSHDRLDWPQLVQCTLLNKIRHGDYIILKWRIRGLSIKNL